MTTNNLMDQINNAADTLVDQTEVSKGFEYTVAPAGYTVARFVGYVEVGTQPQRAYEGAEKPDAAEVRLTFELLGPKHKTEYEVEGVKKTRYNLMRQTLTISNNEKSNFFKLLNKMIAGRSGIKHMAQMLGEGFLIMVSHSKSKDGKKTYANMKSDVWNIGAPAHTDPISNETIVLAVPETTQATQLLLWGSPSTEQWATIFIDGTYEKEVDGVKISKSKNFLQETCMSASNFSGSALESLLGGSDDLVAAMSAPPAEKAPAPVVEKAPPADALAVNDPLAALGL